MNSENADNLHAIWNHGDTLRFPPYISIWEVQQVVERGLVVELEGAGGHRHLIEWAELAGAHRPTTQDLRVYYAL